MKEGDLLLNWHKKPVAILICNETNKVFWFKHSEYQRLTKKQMKALFFSEEGLQDSDLRGVILRDADLIGANLIGAYLIGAYLKGANLRGTNHNHNTVWPCNFNKSRLSS